MPHFFKRNDETIQHFRSRVLPLHIYVTQPNKRDYLLVDPASGFLAKVEGTVWLFTAGHVIADIRRYQAAGVLYSITVVDMWSGSDGMGIPVVVPKDSKTVMLGTNESPPDLGAIRIDPYTLQTIDTRCEPIPNSHWEDQPTDFDYYFLLGGPKELVNTSTGSGNSRTAMFAPPAIVRFKKIPIPDYADPVSFERIHGTLVPSDIPGEINITVNDIDGVSGGPVFGCKQTADGIEYWVVGVQSSWSGKPKKNITADYARTLYEYIRTNNSN